MSTGFGREAEHNMFHGGTVFRDTCSKYIFIKNQVSLGAGETISAKNEFGTWLWDSARVTVKHYHSDNGVFRAEAFTDSCKEEGQSQTFSGVGAQHQNAEAERAIQTVVYMAIAFMVHCTLYWRKHGSNDIALWSFALDHVIWLYNKIPQRESGLTPLKMFTSCKADHKDLARTHV